MKVLIIPFFILLSYLCLVFPYITGSVGYAISGLLIFFLGTLMLAKYLEESRRMFVYFGLFLLHIGFMYFMIIYTDKHPLHNASLVDRENYAFILKMFLFIPLIYPVLYVVRKGELFFQRQYPGSHNSSWEYKPFEVTEEYIQKVSPFLQKTIQFYRDIGLYNKTSSDTETIKKIVTEEYGGWLDSYVGGDILYEYDFLDALGIGYWADAEADVLDGNMVYVEFLTNIAHLTNGVFNPTHIEERWESDIGPVEVSFNVSGEKITLHPKYLRDYIDLDIVGDINKLLAKKGSDKRFESIDTTGQDFCLVFITKEQKAAMKKRGVKI